ncbi:tripartite tricarboxylate transporter TctB family protein [Georgenia sp. MJ170]|uniref:tripartite tricarboxylate transporter TctB family protein n=1 Tax=Georgenia sunbinii TaxID=3117728 RepID=UPI002F26A8E3
MDQLTEQPGAEDEAPPAKSSRAFEAVVAVIAIAGVGTVLLLTRGIESTVDAGGLSPSWWPTVLATVGLALAVILLATSLVRPVDKREDVVAATPAGWRQAGLAAVAAVGFLVAWSQVGFVVPALVFLVALCLIFGARSVKVLVLFPVGITGLIYVLFDVLLRVPL